MGFVHLHTHSHYTIGRGVAGVRDLVRCAARMKMRALALTDTNTIAGYGELVAEAEARRIQPILGCEVHVLPHDHTLYQKRVHPIVVLVRTDQGYRNLTQMLSHAHNVTGDTPPHITLSDLERFSEGLIVLTGSADGELCRCLVAGETERTTRYLNRLAAVVEPEWLFFEVTEYPDPVLRQTMDYVLEISRFLNIPAVATQDVYFIDPSDMPAYCAIEQQPRLLAPQWPLPHEQMPTRHFTSEAEMRGRFHFRPDLIDRSAAIAEACDFRFPRQRSRVPLGNFDRGEEPPSLLWDRAVRGAAARYGSLSEAVKERLNREYRDIRGEDWQPGRHTGPSDLSELFLFLQDMMQFVRRERLCHGVGRGSLVSSVLAYALGITDVDPLTHALDYRSPRSGSDLLPPFEMDLSSCGVGRVLDYLRETCGLRHVAPLGKRVDWDRTKFFEQLCRWAGLPKARLSDFPPERRSQTLPEPDLTLDLIGEIAGPAGPKYSEAVLAADGRLPLLGENRIPRGESLREHRTLAAVVQKLHPCPRRFDPDRSEHIVSKEPLDTLVPLITDEHGELFCQAIRDLSDRLLIPRLHFLSPPEMNIIEKAEYWIRQEEDTKFSVNAVAVDDDSTFKLLGLGMTNGIGPLHSITLKSLLRSRRPRNLSELLEVCSIGRSRGAEGDSPDRRELLPDCMQGYWCAYLKAHHSVSFMTAMLTYTIDRTRSVTHRPRFQIILREARKMGFEVLGPDINLSFYEFSQERRKIRTGLMAVHGVGEKVYEEIDRERRGVSFSSLEDFCRRTAPHLVTDHVVTMLVKAGAFDRIEPNRTQLLHEYERNLKNVRPQRSRVLSESSGELRSGSPQLQLFSPDSFDGRNASESPDAMVRPLSSEDIVQYECEAIGYALTQDMLDHYRDLTVAMSAISPFEMQRLSAAAEKGRAPASVFVVGFVDHVEHDGPLVQDAGEAVLDLEGHVVKVPAGLDGSLQRIRNARGPVLIEGSIYPRGKYECFLSARRIHLLEEVVLRSREVVTLRLNLAGENPKTLSLLRAILKKYKGRTRLEVVGFSGLSRWRARGVVGVRVFFCPPLYRDLCHVIDPARIFALDGDGKPVAVPY